MERELYALIIFHVFLHFKTEEFWKKVRLSLTSYTFFLKYFWYHTTDFFQWKKS